MSRVLVISDLHLPFTHPKFLEFCLDVRRRYRTNKTVFIGDLVDSHALSFHDHDPNGLSAGQEIETARELMKPWVKAFPKAVVTIGNHDERQYRRARKYGLPDQLIRTYGEVYGTKKWEWVPSVVIDGVFYFHGTGSSGKDAAINQAIQRRMSVVQGHTHTYAGYKFHANETSRIFGLNVGCGIDDKAYAFAYSKPFVVKPVLGVGVVIDGQEPHFIAMPMGKGEKFYRGEK